MNFTKEDNLRSLFEKYFDLPQVFPAGKEDYRDFDQFKKRIFSMIDRKDGIGNFGSQINAISHLHGKMFASQALKRLKKVEQEILGYKFKEPLRLLEALTHRSGKSHYFLPFNYEKLEILGDAVLDYIANSNLLRFTLFERYLESDTTRVDKQETYKFGEDFSCADAH